MSIGEILIRNGAVTSEQIDQARSQQRHGHERLGETLVRLQLTSEAEVQSALAEQTGLPTVDLADQPPDPSLLREVPLLFILRSEVVPIQRQDGRVTVALADPFSVDVLDELRLLTGCEIEARLARPTEIKEAVRRHYGVGAESLDRAAKESVASFTLADEPGPDDENGSGLELAEDAALIQFVNQLLVEAVRDRASDVHVEPSEHDLRIRYRIDGVLHEISTPPQIKAFQSAIISRLKIMADLDIAEKRLPQDGRIKIHASGREIDVRVSIIPTLFGEGVALRLLDPGGDQLGLLDLGMDRGTLERFQELIAVPHGVLLVTGPTGSGKTTTLYAGLSEIDSAERKIITVEDPVEYRLRGVSQIQVQSKIGLSFANGLRAILRHDPDVVMIGEIRDAETAEIAIQSALTGHLVLSTLHTNDAPSSVTRLLDMGIEPYLVASTVTGVIAQRLVRRICPDCRESRPAAAADQGTLVALGITDLPELHMGAGCKACRNTGFRGRLGIFELLAMDDGARELTLTHASASQIRDHTRKQGFGSLRDDGLRLIREGWTTPEEVMRVTGGR